MEEIFICFTHIRAQQNRINSLLCFILFKAFIFSVTLQAPRRVTFNPEIEFIYENTIVALNLEDAYTTLQDARLPSGKDYLKATLDLSLLSDTHRFLCSNERHDLSIEQSCARYNLRRIGLYDLENELESNRLHLKRFAKEFHLAEAADWHLVYKVGECLALYENALLDAVFHKAYPPLSELGLHVCAEYVSNSKVVDSFFRSSSIGFGYEYLSTLFYLLVRKAEYQVYSGRMRKNYKSHVEELYFGNYCSRYDFIKMAGRLKVIDQINTIAESSFDTTQDDIPTLTEGLKSTLDQMSELNLVLGNGTEYEQLLECNHTLHVRLEQLRDMYNLCGQDVLESEYTAFSRIYQMMNKKYNYSKEEVLPNLEEVYGENWHRHLFSLSGCKVVENYLGFLRLFRP